jgi:hypothetical protein
MRRVADAPNVWGATGRYPSRAGDPLDEIAAQLGTDKGTRVRRRFFRRRLVPKRYTIAYERHLSSLRELPLTLLEIGVDRGASLKVWEEWLPRARIYGIDIDPRCLKYGGGRKQVFVGDQADVGFLEGVVAQTGPLDIVIDDGSHVMDDQQVTLNVIFPHLASGGIYAIEDLHTAYMPEFGGGYGERRSTIELVKHLIDDVHGHRGADAPDLDVESIHVYQSLVLLYRR